ncbi:MAG TPA: TenA family protein [Rhodothermales bacterium]|nr:TenA family protein [Rhodothermales bacterium]
MSEQVMSETEREEIADLTLIVPPFAESCIRAAGEAWSASNEHPFVVALVDGSLDPVKFKFYQMQDARYLEAFADACSLISMRCPDPDDKLWFIEGARLAVLVESQLHAGYGAKLGYTAKDIAALDLTPNNRAYQDHMVARAVRGSLVEAVGALAPCPWLYTELGTHFKARLGGDIPDEHPYADWLRTYADPGFIEYTNDLLAKLERYAGQHDEEARVRAREAFAVSVRYEWMFWQQAWELQRWAV